MRTVLIGSDFTYDINGVLKPIEINTNVGFTRNHLESVEEIFDTSHLQSFITNQNFIKIHYIGSVEVIKDILTEMCENLNIEFEHHNVEYNSITIPYIEDSEEILIIRSAYDTTALVDDTYCRDKVEFMKLIQSQTFGTQFAYKDDNGDLVSNITSFPDNGNHPNFILKVRYPRYDKEVYPKLYKVSNQQELDVVLENVTSEYFLMEYYYNPLKHFDDKVTKIRGLNILYPPTLESIPFGKYTDTTVQKVIENPIYDTTTFELDLSFRDAYITTDSMRIIKPKLLDTDLVQMADGTFKTGLELEVGDIIKTLNIPNAENVDSVSQTVNYNIDLETFISGSTYSTNKVIYKSRVNVDVNIAEITFTDLTTWEDTNLSSYLVERDDEVRFIRLNELLEGDIVILIDTSDPINVNVTPKTVKSVSITRKEFSGWVITVERKHLFLTVTDSNNTNLSYAAVEHNFGEPCSPYAGFCGPPFCSKGILCTPTGYGSYCLRAC